MPFLYAGGAQWSIHRKHGLFCWIHNPRSCFLPWFLASAFLLLIYVRFKKTSSLISWKDKYRREFSCMPFLKLLLHAWKKQIKYVDQWAFFVGGLFCLNSQSSEHRDCLLLLSSQWTKPQSVYSCLVERSTLSQRRRSCCSAATAATYRQMCTKHTQDTVSQITFPTVFPVMHTGKILSLMHVMYSVHSAPVVQRTYIQPCCTIKSKRRFGSKKFP